MTASNISEFSGLFVLETNVKMVLVKARADIHDKGPPFVFLVPSEGSGGGGEPAGFSFGGLGSAAGHLWAQAGWPAHGGREPLY